MVITRLDCSFFNSSESEGGAASYVALNPQNIPGSLVVAGSFAVRESIGSQVAAKLALQHYVEGVSQYFFKLKGEEAECVSAGESPIENLEGGLELLEAAFRTANSSVYEFGHKLAAGGRMAASLISLSVLSSVISCGRVGPGTAYLCRGGEVFPFFEQARQPDNGLSEQWIGSNSMVSVDLASVPLCPMDIVFVFSMALSPLQERELSELLRTLDTGFDAAGYSTREADEPAVNPCRDAVLQLFQNGGHPQFALMVAVGPDSIYLDASASVEGPEEAVAAEVM